MNVFHHDLLATLTPITSYLEIGVQEGNSLAAVVAANPGLSQITLCDEWGRAHGGTGRGSHAHIDARLASLGYTGRVTYLDGLSQRLIPTLKGQTFDLVHIDGDHSANAARTDLENIWPLAAHYIVVHDVFFMSVWEAASAWLMAHKTRIRTARISASDTGTLVVEVG